MNVCQSLSDVHVCVCSNYQSGSVRHVPSLDSISCAVDGVHIQVTHTHTPVCFCAVFQHLAKKNS